MSVLFAAVVQVRNLLFDLGLLKVEVSPARAVCVGNLAAGGTGKTPFIEYLLRYAPAGARCVVVSRGYGRTSKGLRRLEAAELDPAEYGDEPCQIKAAFPQSEVLVAERRAEAYRYIAGQMPCDYILLDDAYQHRYAGRHVNVLLTTYQSPFTQDWVLPAGNLREPRSGAARADMIVVTKCPPAIPNRAEVSAAIRRYNARARVAFAGLTYMSVQYQNCVGTGKALVVTSIAEPKPLYAYLSGQGQAFAKVALADHAEYTDVVLAALKKTLAEEACMQIITTEKDWVKISGVVERAGWQRLPIGVVQIRMEFFDQEDKAHLLRLVYGG